MSRFRSLTIMAAGAALALAACGDDDAESASTATSGADTTTTADDGGAVTGDQLEIPGFDFAPVNLTVAAGQEITVENTHNQAHTATSDDAGVFDTGTIAAGESATFTVDEPGTYPYHCSLHPFMEATLTVE